MKIVPSGLQLPFEVTYAPSLFVGMQVIDYTTGEPVPSGSVIPMLPDSEGSSLYVGLFTPAEDHVYALKKNVYTDGTYETVDSSGSYSQASESFIAQQASGTVRVIVNGLKIEVGCTQQPRQRPVIVAQNSDQNILLSFFDEFRNPLDITDATGLSMTFLESDNMTVLEKELGVAITLVEGVINQAVVAMVAADFALLPPGDNDAQVIVIEGNTFAMNIYSAVSVEPAAS